MAMNRVQFQHGLSMAKFLDRYGSEDQCEVAVIASRWPQGFVCPACSSGENSSFRREGRLYWQCSACRYQCSVISGTIFEATKLPLTSWFRGAFREFAGDTLLSSPSPYVNRPAVEQVLQKAPQPPETSRALWSLVMFELWRRECAGEQ